MTRETPADARRRLSKRLQVEAAEIAIEALVEVARDPNSTSQARATAGTSLLRAAGFFAPGHVEPEKEPSGMTAAELDAFLVRAKSELDALDGVKAAEADGIFD